MFFHLSYKEIFRNFSLTVCRYSNLIIVYLRVCFQAEEDLSGLAQAELSEVAQSELMALCEQQFAQLEMVKYRQNPNNRNQHFHELLQTMIFSMLQLQNKIILRESDFRDDSQEQVQFLLFLHWITLEERGNSKFRLMYAVV